MAEEDTAKELERFRRQWQQEVTQRAKESPHTPVSKSTRPPRPTQISNGAIPSDRAAPPILRRRSREAEEQAEETGGEVYHDLENKDDARRLGEGDERIHPSNRREPRSALDHYEFAVERETEGSLGDSLDHYRKAYRASWLFPPKRISVTDVTPARCRRRSHLQEQALPAFVLQVETERPQSI